MDKEALFNCTLMHWLLPTHRMAVIPSPHTTIHGSSPKYYFYRAGGRSSCTCRIEYRGDNRVQWVEHVCLYPYDTLHSVCTHPLCITSILQVERGS